MQKQLNEKWIKASVLGTIWAASEIVLGSFLHTIRVPFSGNILTAIGLIILISTAYKWKDKGIFWRAGLITALLKTMSPSAVIFGPMIAIFAEAVLLEFSTRIIGRNISGFLLGSVLAMCWNLFQKIFKLIIFYGNSIIEVYTNLMQYAEKQLNLKFDAVWLPLLILLIIYGLFGAFSAIIGIRIGRKLNSKSISVESFKKAESNIFANRKNNGIKHSLTWLLSNFILMLGSLILIGKIPFGIWVGLCILIALTWALRYRRALRQLAKPRLWFFFVLITMITAFVFTRLQSEPKTLLDALYIGIEMNLRAIILLMGFTVLGTELYNPKVRSFLGKGYAKNIPPALELSLESLPLMIANTPDFKTIVKNPFLFVQQIMAFADYRLNELKNSTVKTIVITGAIGSGKTTFLKELNAKIKLSNRSVSGFYSERIIKNEETIGYDVVAVEKCEKAVFLRKSGKDEQEKVGPYFIYEDGVNLAQKSINSSANYIFIDEIGKLELKGKGWANILPDLVNSDSTLILSLREEIHQELIRKFKLKPTFIFTIGESKREEIYGILEI